jgi:hypothetical protein
MISASRFQSESILVAEANNESSLACAELNVAGIYRMPPLLLLRLRLPRHLLTTATGRDGSDDVGLLVPVAFLRGPKLTMYKEMPGISNGCLAHRLYGNFGHFKVAAKRCPQLSLSYHQD